MDCKKYIQQMRMVQANILSFINEDKNTEEYFQILTNLFDDLNYNNDKQKLRIILNMIAKIVNNHHRVSDFFCKIEKILMFLKDDIINIYSNSEIFDIFKRNKRILLFLIQEKMIIVDEYIIKIFTKNPYSNKYIFENYLQYFSPEIQPLRKQNWFPKLKGIFEENNFDEEMGKELPENFYENRKAGENHNPICKIIQNDSIEEFISYINQNNLPYNAKIEPSIYETNSFLIKKQTESKRRFLFGSSTNNYGVSLIEYAAFFGSNKIFKFLYENGAKISHSLMLFVIHGNSADLFQYTKNDVNNFFLLAMESIKCHHNEMFNNIQSNYLENENLYSKDFVAQGLKYYNYAFIENSYINKSTFNDLCKYNHYTLVDILLKNKDIDVNEIILFVVIIQFCVLKC
ncbi:hypothetical protein M9Y10_031320 [Tritrichomonas musculus]|uniref:DUF3447 domain-containing protein n=1 Tax=Tritrichomonas musculus TaxID=1915356 RepID=A0ABR2H3J3_9EUKA